MADHFQPDEYVDITIKRARVVEVCLHGDGNGRDLRFTYAAKDGHAAHSAVWADAPGVIVERVIPADQVMIPVEVAAHVLGHFGCPGGWLAGSFKRTLILAIAQADFVNRARLAMTFPDYAAAVELAQNADDGVVRLQAIVARGGA
ncbi:hypothetical protein [Nonomuraea sp. NPDC049709]|uniref:hypothetical protein n=1 Tax=Nonomuraea sp. NPDC049709 TaxID=3154736 RepID=UPI0034189B3E